MSNHINKTIAVFVCFILALTAACSSQPAPTLAPETVESQPLPAPSLTPLPSPTALISSSPTPAPTPTPGLPPEPFWGIHVHNLANPQRLKLALDAGSVWARFDRFHWELIEPENVPGEDLDWSSVDEAGLIASAENGINVIGVVQFTPGWAQLYGGVSCGPVKPDALDDFGDFFYALVSRYSQAPFNVKYWEIGNEPDIDPSLVPPDNHFGCWGDEDDPYYGGGYYAQMLESVYPRIKQADPQANVLVGGLVLFCDPVNPPETSPGSGELRDCTPSRFLEGILEAGGGEYFDGISFHAYDLFTGGEGTYENAWWNSSSGLIGPALIAKTGYLRALLASYGYSEKGLYNTETAVLCGSDGKDPICSSDVFNQTKSYYAAQTNAAALALGLDANIWYSLPGWRASGLVNAQLEPFPVYDAYRFSVHQLQGAAYRGEVRRYAGVLGYEFERPDARVMLLWSRDEQAHLVEFDSPPSRVYDVYGNSLEFTDGFTIGPAPRYLEWDK